jgi:hypothetical protein
MKIERLSELYLNGYYSKALFYLELISLLSRSDEPDRILEKMPESLEQDIINMAKRHYYSALGSSNIEESKNPEMILRWKSSKSEIASSKNGPTLLEDGGRSSSIAIPKDRDRVVHLASIQEAKALDAIGRLEGSHKSARVISRKLQKAVKQRRIAELDFAQHSRWCHSDSGYQNSVEPARDAARAMYGFVPDRLIEKDEKRVPNYRTLMATYRERLAGRRIIP